MDNEQIKKEIENLKELKTKLPDDLKDIEINIDSMIERLESKIKPLSVWEKYDIKQFPCDDNKNVYTLHYDGKPYLSESDVFRNEYAEYPTKEKAEKVSKLCYLFRKALHVMEQLNAGYEWDISRNNFGIDYDHNQCEFGTDSYRSYQESIFYFPTKEKAEAFLEIIGKAALKTLHGIKE